MEVAHPKITNEVLLKILCNLPNRSAFGIILKKETTFQFGPLFLECCDFMIGSPTALANAEVESKLRSTAMTSGNGLYVPSGAFWGGEDVRKMADRGTLKVKNSFMQIGKMNWHSNSL